MARLYSNENFPLPVVQALRLHGHDVLTVLEAGNADQAIDDLSVLRFAMTEQRAVLTLNRKHFVRLHQEVAAHEGIVVCTFDPDFERQAKQIDQALLSLVPLTGKLIRGNRPPR